MGLCSVKCSITILVFVVTWWFGKTLQIWYVLVKKLAFVCLPYICFWSCWWYLFSILMLGSQAEFMEHDEKPLPIDIRTLGQLAEKVRICFWENIETSSRWQSLELGKCGCLGMCFLQFCLLETDVSGLETSIFSGIKVYCSISCDNFWVIFSSNSVMRMPRPCTIRRWSLKEHSPWLLKLSRPWM